MNLE
jgi:fructose-bisphosphate aldolase class I